MSRADAWLRRSQAVDGSWRGVWGVQFIYGVMFGIRGLLAGGARPEDPALRLACRWLLDRQRSDGGWGEHHGGCLTGAYVAHEKGQIIQTAWALIALLEAGYELYRQYFPLHALGLYERRRCARLAETG